MNDKAKSLLALTLVVILISAAALIYATYSIRSVGRIKAIGVDVFWDQNGIQRVTMIDWGLRSPGDMAGVDVWIKNTKNVNFTMKINATNWDPPEAAQYLSLDWNYSGAILEPEQIIPVQITLQVSPETQNITNFSFDIVITATEVS